PPELLVAPDERRRRRAGGPVERHDAIRGHGLRAALERKRADELERYAIAHESPSGLADDDVAVLRFLLESRRDVQGIADAGRELVADADLAGVDGDAQTDRTDHRLLGSRELAEGILDSDGRTDGADRVVLGDAGHAERAHDAIAEELHHGPAMRFD